MGMRVISISSQERVSDAMSCLITFEENGVLIEKSVRLSGCAMAVNKGKGRKSEWGYQCIKATREAMRDFAYSRGEDPSLVVLEDAKDFPQDYTKISDFVNKQCE